MPIFIDPVSRQRVVHAKHSGDIVYNVISDSAVIRNEEVPVIGNWNDYTGSATIPSPQKQQFGGNINALQGTSADIEGHAKLPNLTPRGQNADIFRQRQKREYKKLD